MNDKMSTGKAELKEEYGKNKSGRALYNAAIRAECYGGNETLDLLELVSHMKTRARGDARPMLDAIAERVQRICDELEADIRQRYDIPAAIGRSANRSGGRNKTIRINHETHLPHCGITPLSRCWSSEMGLKPHRRTPMKKHDSELGFIALCARLWREYRTEWRQRQEGGAE